MKTKAIESNQGDAHLCRIRRSFQILDSMMPFANDNPNRVNRRDVQKAWASLQRQFWSYFFWLEEQAREKKDE